MNGFKKINDSEASRNQPRKMDANEHFYQRPTIGRRPMYPEQSSFPKVFGQRPTFESRNPITTLTPTVYNAARSVGTPNRRVINYSLSKNNDVQLKTCENAWVPPCMRRKITSGSLGDNNTEEIRKKFLSILNKISPENMTMLTDSITSLPIDADDHLKTIIEILFQKAIDEPSFTPQYAYICTVLNEKKVKPENKAKTTCFKKLLTKCCKDRFEVMRVHEQNLAKILEEISNCNDQEKKKQLQSEYDQDEMVHRKKSIGNCRFMCELYKVQILTNETLEACIKHLLKSANEETLECACNILKHAGKTLNSKVAFEKLNQYTSSACKTKISTRIRFMILDIIELKENNWVPRNSRTKPEVCLNKVHSNAVNPEDELSTRVQNKPAILPTKITQNQNHPLKIKPPTKIEKDDDRENDDKTKRANTSNFYNSSSALCFSDVIKGKSLSVLSCVGSETSNTNCYQIPENKNTGVQELQEKFQTILDNITPENMISSTKSIISLPIKTDVCLINIVEILFQKALDEPSFAPQYAYVCLAMKNIEIQLGECKKTTISFRKLLIKMCQDAFESMYTRKRIVANDRIEIESCKDKKTKNELQLKFNKNETVHRKRSVANCRFICELLKVNILIPPVLEMCLGKLIQSPKELPLECVCIILQHVGSTINHSGVLEKLREYSTSHKPNFSSSVRSMILETLELMNTEIPIDIVDQPSLMDETKVEISLVEPPIKRFELPSSNLRSLSMVQNSVCPEINTQIEKEPNVRNKPLTEDRKLDDYNIVKTMINSVTADNKNTTINELIKHLKNVDVMERTIDFIFERAKIYPKAIPELVSVCSSLRDVSTSGVVEGRCIKPTTLKKQIAIRCSKVLLSGVQNEPSENDFTSEQSYTFIGELFNENVLSAHILVEFLRIVPDKLSNKMMKNVCDLLKVAGKKLEQVYSLKKTVRKLTDTISNDAEGIFSRRSGVLLKALVKLRDNKWVS